MLVRARWVVMSMAGIVGATRVARAQSFELGDEYTLPANGITWVSADFDGDGKVDIATITTAGNIDVSLNDGTGHFTPSARVTSLGADSATHPALAASGDFDGDGAVDLLVTSNVDLPPSSTSTDPTTCTATLFRNLGDGTFVAGATESVVHAPPSPYGAPEAYRCSALNAADYDGDGALDFALESTSFYFLGFVSDFDVFLGRGDGSFFPPTETDLPMTSYAMASADFDGDGKFDIALGEEFISHSGAASRQVEIYSQGEDGQFSATFTEPISDLYGLGFVGARTGDVTGDGLPDFLVYPSPRFTGGFTPSNEPVVLFSNAGGGTLSPPALKVEEVGGIGLESADFDGDRKPDLMVVSEQDRAQLARGDGLGNYSTVGDFSTGGEVIASLAADFDGDGRSDFAVLDAARPVFRVALAERNGVGFPLPRVTPIAADSSFSGGTTAYFASGDYDADGRLDLLISDYGVFQVLFGTGDGWFTPGPNIGTRAAPVRPIVGDIDADGTSDVVLPASESEFETLFGSPDRTFSGVTDLELGTAGAAFEGALGDFDADGDLDLAAYRLTADASGNLSANVTFYANDGAGHFSAGEQYAVGTVAARLLFADLNGDSHLDLFVGASPDGVSLNGSTFASGDSLTLLGDGTGAFVQETALGAAAHDFELGDLNGDGRPDLVTDTGVALGRGDGTFTALANTIPPSDALALGDIDRDGRLDLVTYGPSMLSFALGNGDGSFQAPTPVLTLTATEDDALPVVGVGDFTGDGTPDLYALRIAISGSIDQQTPEVVTVLNRAPEAPPPPPPVCPPPHGRPPHGPFHHRPHRPWGLDDAWRGLLESLFAARHRTTEADVQAD